MISIDSLQSESFFVFWGLAAISVPLARPMHRAPTWCPVVDAQALVNDPGASWSPVTGHSWPQSVDCLQTMNDTMVVVELAR